MSHDGVTSRVQNRNNTISRGGMLEYETETNFWLQTSGQAYLQNSICVSLANVFWSVRGWLVVWSLCNNAYHNVQESGVCVDVAQKGEWSALHLDLVKSREILKFILVASILCVIHEN